MRYNGLWGAVPTSIESMDSGGLCLEYNVFIRRAEVVMYLGSGVSYTSPPKVRPGTANPPNRAGFFFLLGPGRPNYYVGTGVLSGFMKSNMTCPAESHGSRWTRDGYWRVRIVSENIPGVPHVIHRERVEFCKHACDTMDPQTPSLNH